MSDADPAERMPHELTPRQRQILDYVEEFIRRNGFFPTMRDIASAVKIKLGTAHYHVRNLRDMGLLPAHAKHANGVDVRPFLSRVVPVLGFIAAGLPIFADENVEGEFAVDPSLADREDLFALKVRGDSMVGKGIFPGDTIVVRHQQEAVNGDIVAALIGEEATVKEYHRDRDGKVSLIPHNDAYEVIDGDGAQILGKVVQVSRTL